MSYLFIDDHVIIFQDLNGDAIEIGDNVQVHLHRNSTIQTGSGGRLTIGDQTHIQPRCQFSAYEGPISIGCRAEIAPACAFYSYDHGECKFQKDFSVVASIITPAITFLFQIYR